MEEDRLFHGARQPRGKELVLVGENELFGCRAVEDGHVSLTRRSRRPPTRETCELLVYEFLRAGNGEVSMVAD